LSSISDSPRGIEVRAGRIRTLPRRLELLVSIINIIYATCDNYSYTQDVDADDISTTRSALFSIQEGSGSRNDALEPQHRLPRTPEKCALSRRVA
jgi:hypothetical protein